MDLRDLREEMADRFDKLEAKLDKYAETTSKNERDVSWIKGSIKFVLSGIITLVGSIVAYFLPLR